MHFHWPSFLLGYGSGLATALFADRLRPVLVEIGSMVRRLVDSAGTALATRGEEMEDLAAEAAARAHAKLAPAAGRAASVAAKEPARRKRAVRKRSVIHAVAPRR